MHSVCRRCVLGFRIPAAVSGCFHHSPVRCCHSSDWQTYTMLMLWLKSVCWRWTAAELYWLLNRQAVLQSIIKDDWVQCNGYGRKLNLKPEQTLAKQNCTSEIHKDSSRLQPANYDHTLFKWWMKKVMFTTFSVFVSLMLQAIKVMKLTWNLHKKIFLHFYIIYIAHIIFMKSVWLWLDCG